MNYRTKITLTVIICLVPMIAMCALTLLWPNDEPFYKIVETVMNLLGIDTGIDVVGG